VGPSLDKLARNKKLMAYTGAAMYGGATVDAAIEGLLPGDPSFALVPALAAAVIVALLILLGPGLPRSVLATLGPIGVVLIGLALAGTPGAGDGAVLYVWPVLWSAFFFGRRGAVGILLWIGVVHALVLLSLPPVSSYPGRWLDVMVSSTVVAIVVLTLVARNDELLEELSEQARTDALTGLLNRRGFEERAAVELARSRREQSWMAVVAFDLDYFKRINDEWGHDVGDRVLVRTGQVLIEHAREFDVVARFGGEEFVVMLPGADPRAAHGFAERVRDALASAVGGGLPSVKTSAGILARVAPGHLEPLLHGADSALYEAKRAGRDRVIMVEHPPELGVPLGARL
jgi:diguanylate cyclase (GGDEF)-like protein